MAKTERKEAGLDLEANDPLHNFGSDTDTLKIH
jgi:hypothetical protein